MGHFEQREERGKRRRHARVARLQAREHPLPHAVDVVIALDLEAALEELDHRSVGPDARERGPRLEQPERPGIGRLCELPEKPGLADPGHPHDRNHLAMPGQRIANAAAQELELRAAPNERQEPIPFGKPDRLVADEPIARPARGSSAHRFQDESTPEQGRRGGGDDDRVPRADRRHLVEGARHPHLRLAIDPGRPGRVSDEDRARVDHHSKSHTGRGGPLGPGDGHPDGQGRERRPTRRIIDGLDTEDGFDRVPAHLLDPSAKALHLLDR